MAKKSDDQVYDAELERSFKSVAGKYATKDKSTNPKKSKKGSIIAICAAGAVLLIAIVVLIIVLVTRGNDKDSAKNTQPTGITSIDTDFTVAGVNIKGLTKEEAISALKLATESTYPVQTMTVKIGEDITLELTPELTGATLDVEGYIADLFSASEADRDTIDLASYLNLNQDAITQAINDAIADKSTTLTHGSYEVVGEVPTEDVLAAETVENFDLKLVVTVGTSGRNLDAGMIYDSILEAYRSNEFAVDYDVKVVQPDAPDLDEAAKTYNIEPVNSEYDKETFTATAHKYGFSFDVEAAKQQLAEAEEGAVLEFPFTLLAPETTQAKLNESLFADELSTHTAYASSVPNGRDVNLKLSCEKINGTVLLPGETFDYNTALGERTAEGGWKKADGYMGSETVAMYGGGICQTSSVLYYCTLLADLEIVTRTNHGYISSYMDPGMDATVSWGWPDFQFKNNTEYPIKIVASASGGAVTISIMGTDDRDYYVKMEYEILKTNSYNTIYKEYEPDNKEGYKDGKVLTSGYTGYTVQTYRCKYNKDTDELISREKEAYNVYSSRDKVVVKIVEPEATKPPETTAPPETSEPTEPTTAPTETTTAPTETTQPTDPTEPSQGLEGEGNEGITPDG